MCLEQKLVWLTLNRFFLRDDFHIRNGLKSFENVEQAWSLFYINTSNEIQREIVYASNSYEWVINQAYEFALNLKK